MVDHWRRQATPATRVAMRHSLHFEHLSCSSIRQRGPRLASSLPLLRFGGIPLLVYRARLGRLGGFRWGQVLLPKFPCHSIRTQTTPC